MQKKLLAATIAAVLGMGGAAYAADVYSAGGSKDVIYAPASNWAGFYFGVNGGYAEANDTPGVTSFTSGGPFGLPGGIPLLSSSGFDSAGAFGGGQVGINWQRDHIVYGIETDLQGASVTSSKTVIPSVAIPGFGGGPAFGVERHLGQSLDWFGSVRGRLGYAFDNTLVYFTGGFAYAGLDSAVSTSLLGVLPIAQMGKSGVETGYTLGGGVEYKINPAWSFKVEYQYIDLGTLRLSGNILAIVPINSNSLNDNFSTIRLGINYHVSPAYEPLK